MSNKSPILGAHMSVSNGFDGAFNQAISIGATAMQIFAKSPMQSKLRAVTAEDALAVKKLANRSQIKSMVIHASYLLNFAKPMEADSYQMKSLIEDVENAEALEGDGAVVHMGKALALDPTEAEKNYIHNIETVLEATKKLKAKVLLENTAGQGSEMGYRLPDYGRILKALLKNSKRVGACIDSAHLFGGGYDLAHQSGVDEAIKELHMHVGLENIKCIHFNDSKKPLASRVDRHEDIGRGTIGDTGLKLFATQLVKELPDLPLILETPEGFDSYTDQIKHVQAWF
ncbi:MAG: deoxyribonuclease IV [Patescibacteria group bacterium]